MKPFVHALALVAAMLPSPAFAFDILRPMDWFAPTSCNAEVPNIRISRNKATVRIDHSQDHRSIEGRMRTLSAAVRDGWTTNGLAIAQLQTEGESVTREVRLQDGRYCVTLNEANFLLGYGDPITIFISNRYPEGTCEYEAILRHERQHVAIYQQVLEQHLKGVVPSIVEAVRVYGPVYAPTAEAGRDRIKERIAQLIGTIADGVSGEARLRNAALDTPESYLLVQSQCDNW